MRISSIFSLKNAPWAFFLFVLLFTSCLLLTHLKEGFDVSEIMGAKAFCATSEATGQEQNKACNQLTKDNCSEASCCVWTSGDKCVAGSASGPLFNTNSEGKTIQLPYYMHLGKCYGEECVDLEQVA